ncbi:glycosyltransferase [Piscirickettsia salmonis]|uniref:glycosyltransferase n=1 Tax=Piscirickettsia salmonis TaxID=1238 RepID=UPI003753005C
MDNKTPYISVVIPVHNEEDVLNDLYQRLFPVLDQMHKPFEVLFTNDGSRDRSSEILTGFFNERPDQVRVIEFNRNYGQHMAIMAGFERVRGEIVITMDADLQNLPEDIPKLVDKVEEGHDVVGGYRVDRQDRLWRKFVSKAHNFLRKHITKIDMQDEGCMLRAYRREIVELMIASGESSTFIPALAVSYAANPTDVPVRHAAREAGESSYNLYKLIRYNFDLFTNFSLVPIQMFTFIGLAVALGSLVLFLYLMVQRVLHGPDVDGIFTLFAIVFFLMGVMLTGMGIMGEYIGRIFQEVRRRPRFVIRHILEEQETTEIKEIKASITEFNPNLKAE